MAIVSNLIGEDVKKQPRTPDTPSLANEAGAFAKEFESVGARKNPKTGMSLCSQTAREDLYRVL
jgi:hypothetical protein